MSGLATKLFGAAQMQTPDRARPLMAPAQAPRHVTVNEALTRLDALAHLSALDRNLTAPPGAPPEGGR